MPSSLADSQVQHAYLQSVVAGALAFAVDQVTEALGGPPEIIVPVSRSREGPVKIWRPKSSDIAVRRTCVQSTMQKLANRPFKGCYRVWRKKSSWTSLLRRQPWRTPGRSRQC